MKILESFRVSMEREGIYSILEQLLDLHPSFIQINIPHLKHSLYSNQHVSDGIGKYRGKPKTHEAEIAGWRTNIPFNRHDSSN